MSASLSNKPVGTTYQQLLHVSDGLTSSLKNVYGGDGISSHLFLSTSGIKFTGLTTVQGDFVLKNKSSDFLSSTPSVGQVAFINNELYIGK